MAEWKERWTVIQWTWVSDMYFLKTFFVRPSFYYLLIKVLLVSEDSMVDCHARGQGSFNYLDDILSSDQLHLHFLYVENDPSE